MWLLITYSNVDTKTNDSNPESVQGDSLSSQPSLPTREKQLPDCQIELDSNPLHWTREDVYQYLIKTDDCAVVAQKCKDEVQSIEQNL